MSSSSSALPHPASSTSVQQPNSIEAGPKQRGEGKTKKQKNVDGIGSGVATLQIAPEAKFMKTRMDMFERLYKQQEDALAARARQTISVALPDGQAIEATSWETTPLDIARQLSKSLAKKVVIAKVDDVLWDLERPLEASCSLSLLDFEHAEGRKVFWHSSAHVLGEAAEQVYGCHLCLGPPTEEGFFYEMSIPGERNVVLTSDFPTLEQYCSKATKEKQKFQRLLAKKEDLLKMFEYNKYKLTFINDKVPDGASTTVYRCGPMIDLCVGPHIPDTGRIEAMKVVKASSSYFLGNKDNDSLQRVYGVSFPDKQQMKEHEKFVAAAAERDHRKIGKDQELFFFHDLSPGSCFWLPHGARIYNTLLDLQKSEYHKRGFQEVMSPNMFNVNLWKTSGHWQNYGENMFKIAVEKEDFGLKPMNCPGHCIMFNSRERSYRELPLRYADFGVLHRNEASGALTGLTRVRRFQQDDAHIFCTPEQVEDEVVGCFDFLDHIYGLFGFEFQMKLSTRPEKRLGDDDTWDKAETALENALNKFRPGQWEINPGDGAFYGPKIDITIKDALRRPFQCGTIQLDFQLPQKFDLRYRTSEGGASDPSVALRQPVMIHRAILGSLERCIAILCEHFAGKWPFWLSPRQVLIIPVNVATHGKYAEEVAQMLWNRGIFAEADTSSAMLNKRIRSAELSQANFILVVGSEEAEQRTVNIRNRDDVGTKKKGKMLPLDQVVEAMVNLKAERRIRNSLGLEDEAVEGSEGTASAPPAHSASAQ